MIENLLSDILLFSWKQCDIKISKVCRSPNEILYFSFLQVSSYSLIMLYLYSRKGTVTITQSPQLIANVQNINVTPLQVKEVTDGKGVDVVFDAIGGDAFQNCLSWSVWIGNLVFFIITIKLTNFIFGFYCAVGSYGRRFCMFSLP